MEMAKKWFKTFKLLALVLLLVGFNVPLIIKPARALQFNTGDVFASVSDGKVQHYNDNGVLLETLDTGLGGYTTGMAFDAVGNLYVTCWDAGTVFVFSNTGAPLGTFGSGYFSGPNSIVFDAAGNAYVGHSFIGGDILKLDSFGNPQTPIYDPGGYGGEFIDLAADQTTMFYTGWGEMPAKVKRFDVGSNNMQLFDFATTLPGLRALDFRLLPNGELLLANYEVIVRLSVTGSVVQTYDMPGEDNWYSLALDPDGISFWSGNYVTNNFYKFEIAPPGNALLGPINTGTPPDTFWALAVYGEIRAARPQRSLEKLLDSTEGTLGDTIHVTITITIPPGETAEITDLLPPELKYMPGTFTVNGPPATPTIGTTIPPPPIRQTVSYTITASGTYTIEFDVRVTHAYRANRTVTNQVVASFYDEEGNRLGGLEDTEDFIIKPFKEFRKNQAEEDSSVRAKTDSQWAIVTDIVNPFPFTMTDLEIKFKFGAEIEVDPPFPNSITHGTVAYTTRGTTQKVFVTWNIPSLLPSETARLTLLASTDFKPGKGDSNEDNTVDILDVSMISAHWTGPPEGPLDYDRNADINGDDNVDILDVAIVSSVWGQSTIGQQEYRAPGTYEMSSEAVLKFTDPTTNMQLSAETDAIYVTALPVEEL